MIKDYPIKHLEVFVEPGISQFDIKPGVLVRRTTDEKSLGTVIGLFHHEGKEHARVLWARVPKSSFAFPTGLVFPASIMNDLVKVQPMTLPTNLVFYMDYTYDSGSLKLDVSSEQD